jgi:hypothetical protein
MTDHEFDNGLEPTVPIDKEEREKCAQCGKEIEGKPFWRRGHGVDEKHFCSHDCHDDWEWPEPESKPGPYHTDEEISNIQIELDARNADLEDLKASYYASRARECELQARIRELEKSRKEMKIIIGNPPQPPKAALSREIKRGELEPVVWDDEEDRK